MKKKQILFFTLFIFLIAGLNAQTPEQKIYIDFGLDSDNGRITASPDKNGNYWNNQTVLHASETTWELINSENKSTGYNLQVTGTFQANGRDAGGLLSPDENLLGDLAIDMATEDYFFVWGGEIGKLKLKNLDRSKVYKIYAFGTRTLDQERNSILTFTGVNEYREEYQTSGTGIGGEGHPNGNIDNIIVSDMIAPDRNGEITVKLSVKSGDHAYLALLKIEEYTLPESGQRIYIDFGPNDTTNGRITPSPDINGNHWNNQYNISAGSSSLTLINSKNVITGYELQIIESFASNGRQNGALSDPEKELLDDFAIATATEDYFYVMNNDQGSLKIKNLDRDKAYRVHIFSSRTEPQIRYSLYNFVGRNKVSGGLQSSGSGLGFGEDLSEEVKNQNNSSIYSSDFIYPDSNGEIQFTMSVGQGGYAYVNAMRIDEYDELRYEEATHIEISAEDINVSGATSQITTVVYPADAYYDAVILNVDDETIAWIDNKGILHPRKNGQVTITASIEYTDRIIENTIMVTITNQIPELYICGTATENGSDLETALPFRMITDKQGSVSTRFEVYTSLSEGGSFNFYTSKDPETALVYGNSSEEDLTLSNDPINTSIHGPVLITVDLSTLTYTILPVNKWGVIGNAVENGEGALSYQGNSVWSGTVNMTGSNESRFYFRANEKEDYSMKRVSGTDDKIELVSTAEKYGVPVEEIVINSGIYVVTLNLADYTYSIGCESTDNFKISIMGSSVARGEGATNLQGYAYLHNNLLKSRQSWEECYPWELSNISIGGNNTTDLLNRFEKDLIADCAGYVVFGLSLGNEGIHENGQPSFDSFRDNMLTLIDKARKAGKVPVVTNSYTRADFNETDYAYVKQMNLLIHEWDVPSFNLLGGIDNLAGRWATGYQADVYHPNTGGHRELYYTLVPSLFDALEIGKPLPERQSGTYYTFNTNMENGHLEFTPEHMIHSFTLSFDVKASSAGVIASFDASTGPAKGIIQIDDSSKDIVYVSPFGSSIRAGVSVSSNEWYKVSLTHYYAQGVTILYVNDQVAGRINEKIVANKFYINDDTDAPVIADYRDLFFYRSAMNIEEITALYEGRMLKSSLEIYAPLDGQNILSSDPWINLAQSTNNSLELKIFDPVNLEGFETISNITVYPNPASDYINLAGLKNDRKYNCSIYSNDGRLVQNKIITSTDNAINVSQLMPSLYLLKIKDERSGQHFYGRFIKE